MTRHEQTTPSSQEKGCLQEKCREDGLLKIESICGFACILCCRQKVCLLSHEMSQSLKFDYSDEGCSRSSESSFLSLLFVIRLVSHKKRPPSDSFGREDRLSKRTEGVLLGRIR